MQGKEFSFAETRLFFDLTRRLGENDAKGYDASGQHG